MKFALDDPDGGFTIRSYSNREIVTNNRSYRLTVALLPDQILEEGFPDAIEAFDENHFQRLLQAQPQIVLLGTGPQQHFPRARSYATLIRHGIGVEVMSTPSACRTFNILKEEGRRVCALLTLGSDPEG